MENIKVFENPEFGKVRTTLISNEPWFVGKDVADALGYERPTDATRKHVDDDDRGVAKIETPSGAQNMTVINESGLYSLVLSSKLPSAKKFKRWVTSEVLPAIASVAEAVECGSKTLLMDEDTCATNFMVRDALMQKIVSEEEEPITPFSDRMRALYEQSGISTILVAGSSGAFFSQADTIIQMDQYEPKDVTDKVRKIVPFQERKSDSSAVVCPDQGRRFPRPGSDFKEQRGRIKHKNLGTEGFLIGHGETDLRLVEQLADKEQSECLACTFLWLAKGEMNGRKNVAALVNDWEQVFRKEGFGMYRENGRISGNMAKPRKEELAAAISRCRGLVWR
jgi:prophage antirepressor-like protein